MPGAIVVYLRYWNLYETEQHFDKPIIDICYYDHPYQLKPEDKDWIIRFFGKDKKNKLELDVFVHPSFRKSYIDYYKKGYPLPPNDFCAKYLGEICGGKEEIIGKEIELDFELFDYYLHQDNA